MLELIGVHAAYGQTQVLRGIDLAVPDDAVVALLGANGAGKTTLLKVISGLLPPTAGRILLDGVNVTGWAPDRLARAGLCHVPEGRGIFKTMTVYENLRLQAPHGSPTAIDRAFQAFPRLSERRSQTAGSLSGGEQQMLAMAHAYVGTPKLVLLDEVSMGLAPTIVDDIFHRLDDLASQGASLMLVEQYVSRALALADYAYVLHRGRVVHAGEAKELVGQDVLAAYIGEGVA